MGWDHGNYACQLVNATESVKLSSQAHLLHSWIIPHRYQGERPTLREEISDLE